MVTEPYPCARERAQWFHMQPLIPASQPLRRYWYSPHLINQKRCTDEAKDLLKVS